MWHWNVMEMSLNCGTVDSSALQRGCQDYGLTSFLPGWSQPGNIGEEQDMQTCTDQKGVVLIFILQHSQFGISLRFVPLLVLECLFSSTCPKCTTAKYILSHPYQILFVFLIFRHMLCQVMSSYVIIVLSQTFLTIVSAPEVRTLLPPQKALSEGWTPL